MAVAIVGLDRKKDGRRPGTRWPNVEVGEVGFGPPGLGFRV